MPMSETLSEAAMSDKANYLDKGEWIRSIIVDFFNTPENTSANATNDKLFDLPIVGFARGDDPLFDDFKGDIGSFYLTPLEIFKKYYPESSVSPGELTVISWVMPHIKQTKLDNQNEAMYPSERWARGKKFGIAFSIKLQKHLIEHLRENGYAAISPSAPPNWSEQISEKYGHSSTWSERHTAYAAGLGTFGLCDGLITKVGKAMRCGSIVAQIKIPPTKRAYANHTEYCLYFSNGSCDACMKRCPAGAITKNGHDKEKCRNYCDGLCAEHTKKMYDLDIDTCGLCQTKVPCESGIPGKMK
jgi:epoxyqueuosine reductase